MVRGLTGLRSTFVIFCAFVGDVCVFYAFGRDVAADVRPGPRPRYLTLAFNTFIGAFFRHSFQAFSRYNLGGLIRHISIIPRWLTLKRIQNNSRPRCLNRVAMLRRSKNFRILSEQYV